MDSSRKRRTAPTITDVAELAGVSRAIASRALSSENRPVSGDNRARVLEAADKLGFKPNLLARSLTTNTVNLIAVIVNHIHDFSDLDLFDLLIGEIQSIGKQVIFLRVGSVERVEEFLRNGAAYHVDAALVFSDFADAASVRKMFRNDDVLTLNGMPDGSSTHVFYGLLNLTHRNGHEHPERLEPGKTYRIKIVLNDVAQTFPAGHRIRLALATSHWPIAWPSPELATLTVSTSESALSLPVREPSPLDEALAPFAAPEQPEVEPHAITKLAGRNGTIAEDPTTGEMVVTVHRERSSYHLPAIDLAFEAQAEEHYRVREGDPWTPARTPRPFGVSAEANGRCAPRHIPASVVRRTPLRSRPPWTPSRATCGSQAATGSGASSGFGDVRLRPPPVPLDGWSG
ncbi:CocE/NonD family hydrolase C-terminal non-catalytic domain-containing protein [Mesorhizobium sp. KR1-2]|uniref:CocE/NonD family hydrolase C-terminal non-catalytic domain-containing protein n=1 Tax=Mesorhizobium sp. KR1-2 TaxID=3156609 RepID=UPI0032B39978